ncbi:MAG: carboxypeptidase-like regulatory domain-containing protein [Mangrovibacterium sp.]
MLTSGSLMAQHTVNGKVISAQDGESLPGVNVVVKGTTQGTIPNIDGNFSLQVESKVAVLQFSFIGFQSQEVLVGNQKSK